MGYFCEKFCCQELSKIAQSGRTVTESALTYHYVIGYHKKKDFNGPFQSSFHQIRFNRKIML